MNRQEALTIIEDDRELTRNNIIELGWNHFSQTELNGGEHDIFVTRSSEAAQNIGYYLIHLTVMWGRKGGNDILIGLDHVFASEDSINEINVIDQSFSGIIDATITNLFELRLIMEMTDINIFIKLK
jgi:hypothetical protein